MRFSLRLNNDHSVADSVALARAAEEAGFHQIWISNDLFLRSAPILLSAIATQTSQIGIGVGVLNPYTMHPAEIAMLAATLDELSGGRFLLGLSAGAKSFFDWIGVEQESPLSTVRESIELIRSLLAGEPPPDTERYPLQDTCRLGFECQRVPPIYIGAMGPKMLALVGELGDGGLPLLFPPSHYRKVRQLVASGVEKRSPQLGELDLAACIWVSVSSDRARARRALAEKIAYYGPALSPLILEQLGLSATDFAGIERALVVERNLDAACSLVDDRMMRIGVVGGPHDVIVALEGLVSEGARHLSLGPPLGPDPLAAVRLLGEQVLPHFGADSS